MSANYPPQNDGWGQQNPQWGQQQGQGPTEWGQQHQPSAQEPSAQHSGWGQQNDWQQQGNAGQQVGWGQQNDWQQQPGWGSQQHGWQQQGSAWADPSWGTSGSAPQKKGVNPLIPILVAVAVIAAGVGIYALTRGGGSGVGGGGGSDQEKAVQGFFKLLNTQRPGSTDFNKYVSGVGYSGFYEASQNHPGGTYTVKDVGELTDGKIPVKFNHNNKDFDVKMAMVEDGGKWKLEQPFASITYRASDDLRFKINETNQMGMRAGKQELHYPGRYKMRAIGGSLNPKAQWEPTKPEYDVLPGETKDINIEAKLTKEAEEESRGKVVAAFRECMAKDDYSPYGCPFKAERPNDMTYPTNWKWLITPGDAADKAEKTDGDSLLTPCYKITGDMAYQYDSRENGTRRSNATRLEMVGCYNVGGYSSRVTWKSR